jgi:hypothetical protein
MQTQFYVCLDISKTIMNYSFVCAAFNQVILRSDKYLATYAEDTNRKHIKLHVKCPLFLPDPNQNWNIPTNFIELFE